MVMPGRKYPAAGGLYRFGFNGKEKDNETYGEGNAYDFGARIYDARLGRTFSIDPAYKEYHWLSGYSFLNNNPLSYTDVTGKRFYFVGGAGNDQSGWNYINRFASIFTKKGIKEFKRVNASGGSTADIAFTAAYKNFSYVSKDLVPLADGSGYKVKLRRRDHKQIEKAVNGIVADLAQHPLKEGEQLNLSGYSYGSVLQANVALRLADMGIKVDNLILIGSPISDKSELYMALTNNENIKKVIRHDIKGDLLSNPKTETDFIKGGIQNKDSKGTGEGPHYDYARPGAEADKKIGELADKLKTEGIK